MSDPEGHERRVHLLSNEQMARIRAYQAATGIASEVEAVRRLIDAGLNGTEAPESILDRLAVEFGKSKSLRGAARSVLATHVRVDTIQFHDDAVSFRVGNYRGTLDATGKMASIVPEAAPEAPHD